MVYQTMIITRSQMIGWETEMTDHEMVQNGNGRWVQEKIFK